MRQHNSSPAGLQSLRPVWETWTLLLLLLLPTLLLVSCEEILDADSIPYQEQIVVQGVLDLGKPVTELSFERTLPVNQVYTLEAAMLPDITGYIEDEGGTRYLLKYIDSGRYTVPDLIPQANVRYTLHAERGDKRLTASTVVPRAVKPDTAFAELVVTTYDYEWDDPFIDSTYNIGAWIKPDPAYVYLFASGYVDSIRGVSYANLWDGAPPYRSRDTNASGLIEAWATSYIHPETMKQGKAFAILYVLDAQYYDFYRTFYRNDDDSPFGNGRTVDWNVKGDGIGLFIGRAIVETNVIMK